ncbi:MAG TPA: hypothetical protein VMW70_07675, partial [Burkholderiales bacterium]|nr:hypothetical protein [Burkholderiales bacterium]
MKRIKLMVRFHVAPAFCVASIVCGLIFSASSVASDIFLLGDHTGYGVTRAQGKSCFAIAPAWVAEGAEKLVAMRPGVFRLPATVKREFHSERFSIVRVG